MVLMTRANPRKDLSKVKRIVVKVGTSSLTDKRSRLDPRKIGKLVEETMRLRARGKEIIIVSSGAIGAGIGCLNLERRPKKMPSLQAAAAVGQGILIQLYSKYFGDYGQPVAQMLLTGEDFADSKRYLNFRNAMAIVLKWGVVPIVNENDSVEVEEIRLGDNDTLSAHVAVGSSADLLIILSDVDGFYKGSTRKRRNLISTVERVTRDIERLASRNFRGVGGMRTKIKAAKMVTKAGIPVVIANSGEKNVLSRIVEGEEIGTLFLSERSKR